MFTQQLDQIGPISGEPIEPAERPRRGRSRWYPGMPGFTPRSTWYLSSPRSWGWLKSAAKNVGRRCEVQGCYKPVERGGRYCTHHRNHRRNYGHVAAKHLPRKLLGTWIVQGQRYIRQLSKLPDDHPARRQLVLARHWWDQQVARADGYESVNWRAGQSHDTRWRRYVATITRHGFTTDKVLALGIAFYIAREWLPEQAAADDAHERFQLARLILLSVIPKLPSWHSQPGRSEKPGFRFMQWAGSRLQAGIGPFCGKAAGAILGRSFGGFPALANTKPIARSTAMQASRRPRFRRPEDEVADDDY